jgi:MinD-like ATPase involved in chromosome partitioning or flagellar assembly
MNRTNPNVGLSTREVEAGLKVKVGFELPTDRAVQLSVNRGEAVVLTEPRSEFSKGIAAIAKQVAPATSTVKKVERKRLLSFARA